MSTAGKVLSVLVVLALLVWIGLLSMVAQRNANWGQKIKTQDEQIATLQKSQTDLRDQLADLKNTVAREQESHELAVAVLRAEVADFEKTLTDSIEALERVKNQVKSQTIASDVAKAHDEHRLGEKTQTQTDIDTQTAEVEKLKGENGVLMAQLEQLRNEFLSTMADNRKMVQRLSSQ
jgi:cell division protein FtsB